MISIQSLIQIVLFTNLLYLFTGYKLNYSFYCLAIHRLPSEVEPVEKIQLDSDQSIPSEIPHKTVLQLKDICPFEQAVSIYYFFYYYQYQILSIF